MRKALLTTVITALLISVASHAHQPGTRVKPFDGVSLKGWNGNPAFWSARFTV